MVQHLLRVRTMLLAFGVTSLVSQTSASAFILSQPAARSTVWERNQRHGRPSSVTSISLNFDGYSDCKASDEEDDDFNSDPLAICTIDSVSWLPPCSQLAKGVAKAASEATTEVRPNAKILPFLPLGTEIHKPHSEHSLSISEPRYVEMYDDLIGQDKVDEPEFVVAMRHPTESGKFAKYGIILKVVDFEKEDENANVTYVARHDVAGIVNIHRILNPSDWEGEETYLRVEATAVDPARESGGGETSSSSLSDEVVAVRDQFAALVEIQNDLDEKVRFNPASVDDFASGVGSPSGFWQAVLTWQQYVEQHIHSRHVEIQGDFEDKFMDYYGRDKELPFFIDIAELPPNLQEEAMKVDQQVKEELGQLRLGISLAMQRLLEANNHLDRVRLLDSLVGKELQRLRMKKSVKAIFEADIEGNEEERSMTKSPSELKATEEAVIFEADGQGDGNEGGDEEEMSMAIPPEVIKATEEAVGIEQMRWVLERLFRQSGVSSKSGEQKSQRSFYDDGDAFL